MMYRLKTTIVSGPSKLDLIMALAGCNPPKNSHNEPFLVEFQIGSKEDSVVKSDGTVDNECVSWRKERIVTRITGIQYESSSPDSFNITGIITQRYLNEHSKKAVPDVNFEGYYNTKDREGVFGLALPKSNQDSPESVEEW